MLQVQVSSAETINFVWDSQPRWAGIILFRELSKKRVKKKQNNILVCLSSHFNLHIFFIEHKTHKMRSRNTSSITYFNMIIILIFISFVCIHFLHLVVATQIYHWNTVLICSQVVLLTLCYPIMPSHLRHLWPPGPASEAPSTPCWASQQRMPTWRDQPKRAAGPGLLGLQCI